MPETAEITHVNQFSAIEILRKKGFLNAIEDGDGNVITDHPVYARKHGKRHLPLEEFFSAEEFSEWVNKLGCKTRSYGHNVIWE